MKRKQIFTIGLAIMLSMSVVGCGSDTGSLVQSLQEQENNIEENKEEESKSVEEASESSSEADEDNLATESNEENKNVEAGILLSRYAANMQMTDIGGNQFTYEEKQMKNYTYFETAGLGSIDYPMDGCIYQELIDLDADEKPELLTINLEKTAEGYEINAVVYEAKNGEVKQAAKKTLLAEAMGRLVDGGTIRILLKDNKYICLDSWQSTFVSADGVWIDLNSCYYDGANLVQMTDFDFCGSDFYELGKSSTELVDQLNTMGFHKSAAAVYDRDVFHFESADEGVRGLLKIRIENSMATGETASGEKPFAWLYQYESQDMWQGMILPDSNSRLLSMDEIKGLSKENLRIARNEIYARYGWCFEDEKLQKYFNQKTWYVAGENIGDELLSDIELENKNLIVEAEKNAKSQVTALSDYLSYLEGAEPLDGKELGEIDAFLEGMDAFGFTLSFYEDIRDVELEEVLYSGAGMDNSAASKASMEEYLKATNQEEVYTDYMACSEKAIDTLLWEKTGYGLADMHRPIHWPYLEKSNAYGREAGDTNYIKPHVIDGVKTADQMYFIQYENERYGFYNEQEAKDCIVVLKKVENGYQFVANRPMY